MLLPLIASANADVPFSLSGLQNGDKVSVTISSSEYLNTMTITADGSYTFSDVPTGQHTIKVEAIGYNLPDSKSVNVKDDGTIEPFTGIALVITKMEEDDSKWTHSWHEDGSVAGYTTTAYVNKPAEIEYLGKKIVPADVPSQSILEAEYHIILSDEGATWTQEYAYRLLETLKCFPSDGNGVYGTTMIISLTTNHIEDDIQMEDHNGGKLVTLATEAFAYANPFLVDLDGVRGRFFSKRLHHAVVNMVTNYGRNKDMADRIFQSRFGCSIYPPDYSGLTLGTTNEDASHFQDFEPSELVEILNMFEEMPEGFHKIPGLNYLIRRQNGHPHPLYPDAAAVTWAENGYIEFMYKAFMGANLFDTHRLMIHEKTHMLWAHTFSEEIKNDWIAVGGWYIDPNVGWATTKDTEFVSAYAHDTNPNEDMAESVAFYIKNPDKLMSRSLPKYEFIRDRIMHGTRYISKIREDLTFEVLNLFPDYDYPGKIKSLDLQVLGKPEEDKTVVIDITLNHIEGFQDGSSAASLRMWSSYIENQGKKFVDMWLYPVDNDVYHLRGEASIGKYNKSGYWTCEGIKLQDEQGNERFEGSYDYVWNMYVDNPLEDLESPVVDGESLRYELTNQVNDGHQEQLLSVYCTITDNIGLDRFECGIWTLQEESKQYLSTKYEYNEETHEAKMMFEITEFYPSCDYYVSGINAFDIAQNMSGHLYYPENRPIIHITTPNPDNEAPEVDLNRMFIYAEPVNKEAPDGETLVTINFYTRDNKSGLDALDYALRDPQGIDHVTWYDGFSCRGEKYYNGDPTAWEHQVAKIILPKGSAPGIWGMAYMELMDKVQNWRKYDFVETLIFEPEENQEDYLLFADMTSADMLNFDLTAISGNTTGYSLVYRVISEETGQEINGVITDINSSAARRRTSGPAGYEIDVSGLADGKLVVIVQVKDSEGKVVAVRSKTVNKFLLGDVNSDRAINVADIVEIVNCILGKPSTKFISAAADLSGDGVINVTDIVKVVAIILSANNARQRSSAVESTDHDRLTLTENENHALSLCLDNVGSYVAAQFDVHLSAGQTLEGITLNSVRSKHHVMTYMKTADNTYRVIVYSLNNEAYTGNSGELMSIQVFGTGYIDIDNILFVTSGQEEKRFASMHSYAATGINDVEKVDTQDVYSIDGRLVRKQTNRMNDLKKGIYIVNGKKHIVN